MRTNKRKGVSISFITIISFVITILLSLVLVSSLYMVSTRYVEVRSSMDDYITWKAAASNVKTASDYLTEQARSFAVTEEDEYLKNYFDEANITKRREKALATIGEKLSDTSAYSSLESAINESMDLMIIEYHSMQLVLAAKEVGVPQYAEVLNNYPLSSEDKALTASEKREKAVDLVFNDTYAHAKNRINTGVTNSIISLDAIMEEEVRNSSKALEHTILLQQIIIVLLVFFLAAICVLVYIFIVLPVRKMVNGLLVGRPLEDKGPREYRYLAEAYNQTREANIADEEKLLYQAEHDLLTDLFNRAGYDHIYKRMDLDSTAYLLIDIDNFKGILPKITGYAGEEFFIRFIVKQRENKPYINKGTELGFSEIPIDMKQMERTPLSFYERKRLYLKNLSDTVVPEQSKAKKTKNSKNQKKTTKTSAPLVEMDGVKGLLQIFNENMEVLFDADKAAITSLKINDKEILVSTPKLNFWRTPTVNDRADENAYKAWLSAGLDRLSTVVKGVNCRQDDTNRVTIDALYGIENGSGEELFDVVQTYLIYCTGDVIINNQILVSDVVKTMPRVGMNFAVNGDIKKVEWFGREKESYSDRHLGSRIGVYSSNISAMSPKYQCPQASGNRTETRWVALESDNESLFVDMLDTLFDFSVQKYTDYQMAHAQSYNSLKENSFTEVNIDYRHAGVGSGNGLESQYLVNDKKYSFVVRMRAFEIEDESPSGIRMVAMPKVETKVLPMPTISKDLDNFDSPMTITLASESKDVEIRYTLDGTEPNEKSTLYKKPFVIENTTVVKAKAFAKDYSPSFTCKKVFNYNYVSSIEYTNQPNTPYNKNLETALFDGVYGSTSNLSDDWIGFSGSNFEAVLALVKPIDIQSVEATFMHAPESWAFAPKSFSVYVSPDGKNYSPEIKADVKFIPSEKENAYNQVITFRSLVNINQVKYIKVVAKSIGKIPSWHEAKGLRPWMFVDEIVINETVK